MGAGKEEDEGGLAPTEDDDAASVYFSRRQAYCPLSTEGMIKVVHIEAGLPDAEGLPASGAGACIGGMPQGRDRLLRRKDLPAFRAALSLRQSRRRTGGFHRRKHFLRVGMGCGS